MWLGPATAAPPLQVHCNKRGLGGTRPLSPHCRQPPLNPPLVSHVPASGPLHRKFVDLQPDYHKSIILPPFRPHHLSDNGHTLVFHHVSQTTALRPGVLRAAGTSWERHWQPRVLWAPHSTTSLTAVAAMDPPASNGPDGSSIVSSSVLSKHRGRHGLGSTLTRSRSQYRRFEPSSRT